MKIEPTGHYVLIKPDAVEELSKGGIVIPIQNKTAELLATVTGVIAKIGPNAWRAFDDGLPWANIGDRVFITKNVGKLIKDQDTAEEYFLITDENVLAVITEGEMNG